MHSRPMPQARSPLKGSKTFMAMLNVNDLAFHDVRERLRMLFDDVSVGNELAARVRDLA